MFSIPSAEPQFLVERMVNASAAHVFDVMCTEAGMKKWVPLCRSASWEHPVGRRRPGVGSVRKFRLPGGIQAAERIVIWKPGRQINYRFDRTTLPFDRLTRDYEGAMIVEPIAAGCSRLSWATHYRMPPGLGALAAPVRAGLRALIAHMADSIVQAAEVPSTTSSTRKASRQG